MSALEAREEAVLAPYRDGRRSVIHRVFVIPWKIKDIRKRARKLQNDVVETLAGTRVCIPFPLIASKVISMYHYRTRPIPVVPSPPFLVLRVQVASLCLVNLESTTIVLMQRRKHTSLQLHCVRSTKNVCTYTSQGHYIGISSKY